VKREVGLAGETRGHAIDKNGDPALGRFRRFRNHAFAGGKEETRSCCWFAGSRAQISGSRKGLSSRVEAKEGFWNLEENVGRIRLANCRHNKSEHTTQKSRKSTPKPNDIKTNPFPPFRDVSM
jgi:hypothetical protein